MRVLFAVPPFAGHVNPTIAVGLALEARGHRVAWLGHESCLPNVLPAQCERLYLEDDAVERARERAEREGRNLRGIASLPFLFEDIIVPLAHATYEPARAHVEAWRPDLLVVDQQMLSGAIIARRANIPWATSVCTPAYGVVDPFTEAPKIAEWVRAQLASLESEFGLPASAHPDCSPNLVIVHTVEELSFVPIVPNVRFVGATTAARPETLAFPWERLLPMKRVYLSLGTINADQGARLYAAAVEGLRDVPVQLIVAAPPELVVDAPAHWIVERRVPQLAVLQNVDAVIAHGGLNTVNESLANGVPLVVAPIRDDQPMIADMLVRAGVAVRVHFGRVSAASLRAAVVRVLDEPAFSEAARTMRAAFARAGGASLAADLIEGVTAAASHAIS